MSVSVHNPDVYMSDLRQIIAQGRKRIGFLIGAGAPAAIRLAPDGSRNPTGTPLIPTVQKLTELVIVSLDADTRPVVDRVIAELRGTPNIEQILSRVRALATVLGAHALDGVTGHDYVRVAESICKQIGEIVSKDLPSWDNPFSQLVSWIGGMQRANPVEIFSTNYDLLFEEAFARAHLPYFDGFSGSYQRFFDQPTVASNDLPVRWARLWKLHGSLGWASAADGGVTHGNKKDATALIYPEALKYDQTKKMPYTALFDRLRAFLMTPDTLLIACGFSFADAHISAVIQESLSANPSASVFAFQYGKFESGANASALAYARSNMNVYFCDAAVINGVRAPWKVGQLPNKDWGPIRASYWSQQEKAEPEEFILGDFSVLAPFFAYSMTERIHGSSPPVSPEGAPV